MSVAFAAPRQRGKGEITPAAIQKMLDDNNHLIQCIMDSQNKGKTSECSHTKIGWTWWWIPVIPTAWEAEAGESLEPGRRRLQVSQDRTTALQPS
ncbi:SS18 isoform 16 [Pan troglodytes]|uniref:SS18 subunit of BAF chromatin remodeling complex n=2 Tax=Homininae TaxID=207598 RepID=J3QQW2_HUMAN|nr:SS18 subunit of BAF chromatin remodeling complex [Homo sapiens]KAI4045839.1 SS18 subunit of BAF chromatin remodeling complex [Homo sapiens]PNI61531.1 SS18 isoform 16 [Pan troglodytes]